jgi:hypothetical protein
VSRRVVASLIAALACACVAPESGNPAQRCRVDDECSSEQVCYRGFCVGDEDESAASDPVTVPDAASDPLSEGDAAARPVFDSPPSVVNDASADAAAPSVPDATTDASVRDAAAPVLDAGAPPVDVGADAGKQRDAGVKHDAAVVDSGIPAACVKQCAPDPQSKACKKCIAERVKDPCQKRSDDDDDEEDDDDEDAVLAAEVCVSLRSPCQGPNCSGAP